MGGVEKIYISNTNVCFFGFFFLVFIKARRGFPRRSFLLFKAELRLFILRGDMKGSQNILSSAERQKQDRVNDALALLSGGPQAPRQLYLF